MGQLWEFFTDECEKQKALFIERVKCGLISESRMRPKWKFEIKQTFKWCPKTLLFCLSLFRCVHLPVSRFCNKWTTHCTEVGFTSFKSGGFPTTVVYRRDVNERKILYFFSHYPRGTLMRKFLFKQPFLFHFFAKTKKRKSDIFLEEIEYILSWKN